MCPIVIYKECAWKCYPDELALIPKSLRCKITSTYKAAVPARILEGHLSLSPELVVALEQATFRCILLFSSTMRGVPYGS